MLSKKITALSVTYSPVIIVPLCEEMMRQNIKKWIVEYKKRHRFHYGAVDAPQINCMKT